MSEPPGDAGHEPVPGKCNAKKKASRGGGLCKAPAGRGTDHLGIGHCSAHLGNTQQHVRSAQVDMAERECRRFGAPIDVGPREALEAQLCEAFGMSAWYRKLIEQLMGSGEITPAELEAAGFYGKTYHVSGKPTGEAKPHVLVVLWMEHEKHLTAVAKAAHACGIDERRVEIEQQKIDTFAAGMAEFARELGFDPADPKVRTAGRRALTVIQGGLAA